MTDSQATPSAPFSPDVTAAVVRYQVRDVDRAIAFYTEHLGFQLTQRAGAGVRYGVTGGPASSPERPRELRIETDAGRAPTRTRRVEPNRPLREGYRRPPSRPSDVRAPDSETRSRSGRAVSRSSSRTPTAIRSNFTSRPESSRDAWADISHPCSSWMNIAAAALPFTFASLDATLAGCVCRSSLPQSRLRLAAPAAVTVVARHLQASTAPGWRETIVGNRRFRRPRAASRPRANPEP